MTDYTNHECDGHCGDTIEEPGKFEGEPRYVRDILWPIVMDGMADFTTGEEYGTTEWIRQPFYCEALADVHGVAIGEDSQGFVWCREFATREEFDTALDEAMAEESGEESQS